MISAIDHYDIHVIVNGKGRTVSVFQKLNYKEPRPKNNSMLCGLL